MLVVVVMRVIGVMVSVPIVMGTTDGAPSKGVKQPTAAATTDGRRRAADAAPEPEAAVSSTAAMINEAGGGAEVCQSGGCRGCTSNPDPGVHQTGLHAVGSQRNHFLTLLLLLLPPPPKVNSVVLLLVAFQGLISNIQ